MEAEAEAEAGRRSGSCRSTSHTRAHTRSRSSHHRSSPPPPPPPDRPRMVIITTPLLLRVTAPKMMPGPMPNSHAAGSLCLFHLILSRYEAAMVLDRFTLFRECRGFEG